MDVLIRSVIACWKIICHAHANEGRVQDDGFTQSQRWLCVWLQKAYFKGDNTCRLMLLCEEKDLVTQAWACGIAEALVVRLQS